MPAHLPGSSEAGWVSLYLARLTGVTALYLQNAGVMRLPLISIAVFGAYR